MSEELIHSAHLTSQCLLSDKCQLATSRHLYVFISLHASLEALNLNSTESVTGLNPALLLSGYVILGPVALLSCGLVFSFVT